MAFIGAPTGPQSNAHQAMCDVETTELTHLNKDMETASNCTGEVFPPSHPHPPPLLLQDTGDQMS